MHQLPTCSLSLISGGYYSSHRRQQVPTIALITPVRDSPHDLSSAADAHGETAACCNQHCHQPVIPKNGDYNSQGQQYSWGTWWDDTH